MRTLLDTNILLRASQPGHAHHADAVSAPLALISAGRTLCVGAQTAYEFLAVASKPMSENGLGMRHIDAVSQLDKLLGGVEVLLDSMDVIAELKRLVVTHQVTGKKVHDCHLVAVMGTHHVSEILTFNAADFLRFTHLQVLLPHVIAQGYIPA
jgi:predicted nucleic acid-binding protein